MVIFSATKINGKSLIVVDMVKHLSIISLPYQQWLEKALFSFFILQHLVFRIITICLQLYLIQYITSIYSSSIKKYLILYILPSLCIKILYCSYKLCKQLLICSQIRAYFSKHTIPGTTQKRSLITSLQFASCLLSSLTNGSHNFACEYYYHLLYKV